MDNLDRCDSSVYKKSIIVELEIVFLLNNTYSYSSDQS